MRAHYHHDGDPNLFYAVVDPTGGTSATSHELAEAFTDPALNAWFSDDDDHPEIGDVCSSCGSQTLILNGFSVASYWLVNAWEVPAAIRPRRTASNRARACRPAGGPGPQRHLRRRAHPHP